MTDQFDDELKHIKKAMQAAGCDMPVVRAWLKLYEKVQKQTKITKENYIRARKNLQDIQAKVRKMEETMTAPGEAKEILDQKIRNFTAELKKREGSYLHEFLVSSMNREYILTYQAVTNLWNASCDMLIFQSEVENLSAMNEEILSRPFPDFRHIGFFEITQPAELLTDLPYEEKVRKVKSLYEADFIRPFYRQLAKAVTYADTTGLKHTAKSSIFKANSEEVFACLRNQPGENKSTQERVDRILEPLRQNDQTL